MSLVYLYLGFAITTGFTAIYELLNPVVLARKLANKPVENEALVYITFLIVNVIAAPLVFLSCIIPSWGDRFRESLEKSLFD